MLSIAVAMTCLAGPGIAHAQRIDLGTRGTLALGESYALPGPATHLLPCDVDADGDTDVVVLTCSPPTLVVYRNDSGGLLDLAQSLTLPDSSSAALFEDLDGDGLRDLVVSSTTATGGVWWLRNRGGGGFAAPAPLVTGDPAVAILFDDLDGDGRRDLVVYEPRSGDLRIFRRGGSGVSFLPSPDPMARLDATPLRFVTGDFDGDGRADFAYSHAVGQAPPQDLSRVAVERGIAGGFTAASDVSAAGELSELEALDVDGDGNCDLVFSSLNGAVAIEFAHPGLGFDRVDLSTPCPDDPFCEPALVGAGRGSGRGTRVAIAKDLEWRLWGLAWSDLGADRAVEDSGRVAPATAEYRESGGYPTPTRVAVTDLNDDGHPDFLVTAIDQHLSPRYSLEVLRSGTAGRMAGVSFIDPGVTAATLPRPPSPRQANPRPSARINDSNPELIGRADMDGDGLADVVMWQWPIRFGVSFQLAPGIFAPVTWCDGAPADYGDTQYIAAGIDTIDHAQGALLAVVAVTGCAEFHLLLAHLTRAGAFALVDSGGVGPFEVGPHGSCLAGLDWMKIADMDGDGRADFALLMESDDSGALYPILHPAQGTFRSPGIEWGDSENPDAALLDLDGDGLPDLLGAADPNGDPTAFGHVAWGLGGGAFGASGTTFRLPGHLPHFPEIRDVDGDGHMDVLYDGFGDVTSDAPITAILYGQSPDSYSSERVGFRAMDADQGAERLTWEIPPGHHPDCRALRSADATNWDTLSVSTLAGEVVLDDRAVTPGAHYLYKLLVRDRGDQYTTPVITVVPPMPTLALASVYPNPARNRLTIRYALAGSEPGRIELFDLSGRRVRTESLDGRPGGTRQSNWTFGDGVAPGLYWLRLTQGAHRATAKVVIAR